MKRPGTKPSTGMPRQSMRQARDGELGLLLKRMRGGRATREEIALAADLLEKRSKPRRLRKGQPDGTTKRAIGSMAWLLKLDYRTLRLRRPNRWPMKKKIIPMVAEAYGVSHSYVEKAMKETGNLTIDEITIDWEAVRRMGFLRDAGN